MKNNRKHKIMKASLTIEASAIMILLIFTIVGTIYLCLFVHNRTWLTAAAYEAAVSGGMLCEEKRDRAEQITDAKARELAGTGFFGCQNMKVIVQTGKNIDVTFSQDTTVDFGNLFWHMSTTGSAKRLYPVEWIRKMKKTSEIVKGVK